MNEVLRAIHDRRSVRKFKNQKIDRAALEQVAQAGRNAPTGMNKQTRLLTVVQQPKLIAQLCDAMGKALDDKGYNMYDADAIVIVSEHRDESNGLANSACAMQNMMLAAYSLGLGSVWINQLKHVTDDADVRTVLDAFEIPADHRAWCNLALGYAGEQPAPKPKDGMTINWFV